MNPMQSIFGGSSSTSTAQQSASSSGQSTSTATNLNPFTSILQQPLGNMLTGYASTPAPQYTGATSLSMTPQQRATMATLTPMTSPNSTTNQYIGNVLGGAYMPGGPLGNANLSASINAAEIPTTENLTTTLSQTDPTMFQAAGQNVQGTGSSAFQNAQALATQAAANADAQIAGTLTNTAYNTGIQQMTAASNLQPQEIQATINSLQAELLPTLLQQQGITNGLQSFQENIGALTSYLQTLISSTAPSIGNNSQATNQSASQGTANSTSNTQTSPFAALFGAGPGGSTGAGNAAAMLGAIGG